MNIEYISLIITTLFGGGLLISSYKLIYLAGKGIQRLDSMEKSVEKIDSIIHYQVIPKLNDLDLNVSALKTDVSILKIDVNDLRIDVHTLKSSSFQS